MRALYKKEVLYYLNNPTGYIILGLFGVFANFLFLKDIFVVGSASMRAFFALVPWLFLIFVPALTMRSLSEEKRSNTIETLLTLPISETQIILAKFFALITLLICGLLLTISLPVSLSFLSQLYFPEILVGYLGELLLGSMMIAIAMFFSSQTKNQVVAFLMSIIVTFLFLVIGTDFVGSVFPKFIQDMLSYFSPLYHLDNFSKGVVDVRSLLFFLSGIVVFIILTIVDLEKRS